MRLIWATRGRTWGFRFLNDGGFPDPLPVYDEIFANIGDDTEVWYRSGETVALRILDPLGRKDLAGRVIPHEFVIFPPLAEEINSVEDGRIRVWPKVADDFSRVWELPDPGRADD